MPNFPPVVKTIFFVPLSFWNSITLLVFALNTWLLTSGVSKLPGVEILPDAEITIASTFNSSVAAAVVSFVKNFKPHLSGSVPSWNDAINALRLLVLIPENPIPAPNSPSPWVPSSHCKYNVAFPAVPTSLILTCAGDSINAGISSSPATNEGAITLKLFFTFKLLSIDVVSDPLA